MVCVHRCLQHVHKGFLFVKGMFGLEPTNGQQVAVLRLQLVLL